MLLSLPLRRLQNASSVRNSEPRGGGARGVPAGILEFREATRAARLLKSAVAALASPARAEEPKQPESNAHSGPSLPRPRRMNKRGPRFARRPSRRVGDSPWQSRVSPPHREGTIWRDGTFAGSRRRARLCPSRRGIKADPASAAWAGHHRQKLGPRVRARHRGVRQRGQATEIPRLSAGNPAERAERCPPPVAVAFRDLVRMPSGGALIALASAGSVFSGRGARWVSGTCAEQRVPRP